MEIRLFVAISGEEFADTLKTIIAPALQANTSLYAQLSGVQKKEMGIAQSIQENGRFDAKWRSKKSHRNLQHTPERVSRPKGCDVLSLISAANLTGDDTVYQNAIIERYADNFPDDPSSGFVAIDLALLKTMQFNCEDLTIASKNGPEVILFWICSRLGILPNGAGR